MYKSYRSLAIIVAAAALSAGCASLGGNTGQELAVSTTKAGQPVAGANCALTNEKGSVNVTTPGSVTVRRTSGQLTVTCEKPGEVLGVVTVSAKEKETTLGQDLLNGLGGKAIDRQTGAAYEYPAAISVELGATSKFSVTSNTATAATSK